MALNTVISSKWGDNFPKTYRRGKIVVGCDCGDANCDGSPGNILDLNLLVNYIFRGKQVPGPCSDEYLQELLLKRTLLRIKNTSIYSFALVGFLLIPTSGIDRL